MESVGTVDKTTDSQDHLRPSNRQKSPHRWWGQAW